MRPMTDSPNSSDEDSVLVENCKNELPYNTATFEKLVRKYEPVVMNTCRYLLSDPDDSEEICQDIFMRVFHHIKNFDQKSTFKTWLYRIARNCCYTKMKQRQKQTTFNRELIFNIEKLEAESEKDNSLSARMEDALNKLSLDDREILTLKFISDLSLKEAAETMEIQLSAAKMRYYRALGRLKEEFKQ